MGPNDALGGIVAQGQAKFLDEAASAKTWGLLAQRHDSPLQSLFGFVGTRFGCSALGAQAGIALVLETAEPFADGVAQAAEVPSGGFDALGACELDELMAQGKMGIVSTDHIVVGLGGGRRSKRFIYHALVSPEVRSRCPLFSILVARNFFAPRAPWPPFPPGGPRGARPLASPETAAATPLTRSKCVERYIEFSSAGKPAEGGHDVPGPRR